ncbi:MAG: hypothetical protein ACHQPI_14725 [Thermoanaerobaculia bacterium]
MADDPKAPVGPRELGPFEPTVYVPPPKEEAGAPFRAAPAKKEPFVTEGMKARRREEEKRRREEVLVQLAREEKLVEGWGKFRRLVLTFGLAILLILVYGRIQVAYPDNRWPLEMVWALIVFGVFGVFGTTLWYLNRGD